MPRELRRFGFPVVILTRSPLVLRDLDLLRRMEWVRAGCSISTASDRLYEPGVPSLESRLETLRALADAGIKTWVSLAPVVPGIMTFEVESLLGRLREAGVGAVSPGLLRFQGYEASRRMFELSTGLDAEAALEGGENRIGEVREAVARAGLRTSDGFFSWKETAAMEGLDSFVGSTGSEQIGGPEPIRSPA